MSKLFYHVAGHKPTAQEQFCSSNPTPFSLYRAKGSGGLSLGRAFTVHISKVPRKGVEQILTTDRKKTPRLYSLDLSASGTIWCSSRDGLNMSSQQDALLVRVEEFSRKISYSRWILWMPDSKEQLAKSVFKSAAPRLPATTVCFFSCRVKQQQVSLCESLLSGDLDVDCFILPRMRLAVRAGLLPGEPCLLVRECTSSLLKAPMRREFIYVKLERG